SFHSVARSGRISPGFSGVIGHFVRWLKTSDSAVICGAIVCDEGSQLLVTVPAAANTSAFDPCAHAVPMRPGPTSSEPAPSAVAPARNVRRVDFIEFVPHLIAL